MTNIYIHTSGCSHNFADSEQMAGLLKQAGFEIVSNIEEGYVIIFNTCTVKWPTEAAFFQRLENTTQKYPHKIIIIAGCIPQADPHKLKKYPLLGTNQIHKIVEVVEEALHDNHVQLLESDELPPLNLPRVRLNPVTCIIPISRGCLGACSFCKTKFSRGNLVSYPIEDIRKEVELALKEGAKEIWLTSQDTGCYGFDLDTNLAKLLNEVTSVFGNFRVRIGIMNPNHILKFKAEFFDVLKNPKIYHFLHLPLQSGSNEVLKKMHRNYTAEEFRDLMFDLKLHFSDMTIATDIIVGFPGETEEQYWETQNLLRQLMPDVVNISRFWPRPGTPAAKMKPLLREVVRHRYKVLSGINISIARMQNERWIGWEGEVLVNKKSKEAGQWIGRNDSFKPIVVEGNYSLGQKLKVKVNRVTSSELRGTVVS